MCYLKSEIIIIKKHINDNIINNNSVVDKKLKTY